MTSSLQFILLHLPVYQSHRRVFVALHDLLLDDVTNVASHPEYADRYTTKVVDGKNTTGYFVSDFIYSELQTLRLNQRLPERTTLYNGLLQIPSFTQVMSLAQTQYNTSGRLVGIYPELKHPSFFHDLGFAMEDMLLDALVTGGYEVYGSEVANDLQQVVPVVVQCFEPDSLVYLHSKTPLPLILLLESQEPEFWNADNMDKIASFAAGIGPEKSYFASVPYTDATKVIDLVHSAGLRLHPWTFRADQDIGKVFNRNFDTELQFYYCCLGMDALFSEFPDRSREALDAIGNYTQLVSANALPVPQGQPVCNLNCADY
jgi:glycerophosphoryl diester phosphodiesterase